jgi:hypothetical protein
MEGIVYFCKPGHVAKKHADILQKWQDHSILRFDFHNPLELA